MCPVIPRGTKLPCTSAQLFSTYADQQPGVSILVYQVRQHHAQQHEAQTAGGKSDRLTLSVVAVLSTVLQGQRASTRDNQFLGTAQQHSSSAWCEGSRRDIRS